MATSNKKKISKYNNKKKAVVATAFKKNLFNWAVLSTLFLSCHICVKVNFILPVDCKNEKKLKVTLKFTLAKVTFN